MDCVMNFKIHIMNSAPAGMTLGDGAFGRWLDQDEVFKAGCWCSWWDGTLMRAIRCSALCPAFLEEHSKGALIRAPGKIPTKIWFHDLGIEPPNNKKLIFAV